VVTLTDTQKQIMAADGHVLVTGGPGSGKTTVSTIKSADIAEHRLRPGQQVLFLGFARATVSRVMEAIEREHQIPLEHRKRILVETYHAFFWRILKAHGYLIGLPRKLSILVPQNEAIALSLIRSEYKAESKLDDAEKAEKQRREAEELQRLAFEEGRVCFDFFAHFAGEILHGSVRIRKLVSTMYPFVILDEFQDTNADQWRVVQAIGKNSTILALADPEQRIYDWIGADPERLDHFRAEFNPTEFDLGTDNHRNGGTEIRLFGDHILRGRFRDASYNGVARLPYEANTNQALTKLVTCTLQARQRLMQSGRRDWSLAVLVPTKRMTRFVSDTFRSPPAGLPEISHAAAVEMEGAILGAELIALIMQPDINGDHFPRFIDLLCDFFRGKGGDSPSKTDLAEAESIRRAYDDYVARSANRQPIRDNSLLIAVLDVYDQTRSVVFSGNPDTDWRAIRRVLDQGPCPRLRTVADHVRNVRLLDRGAQLRQALSQDWRANGAYRNALEIVRQTFVQEHFAMAHRPETGVVVMNMHKAKGKQFDEVIIFDGWPRIVGRKIMSNPDRIVRSNSREHDNDQARQNFRVSVTRGKTLTTILTPRQDRCILLLPQEG
jgi:DNA helicase-2/ATP-dependent DNA helicase PcrA